MKQITSNTVLKQEDRLIKCSEYKCGNSDCIFECINPKQVYKSYPAIQTEQGIIWIDKDAEIISGYNVRKKYKDGISAGYETYLITADNFEGYGTDFSDYIKIIAANFELKGVPMIKLVDEVEKLWGEFIKSDINNGSASSYHVWLRINDGYKANQNKYTEEDMVKCWCAAIDYVEWLNEPIIQSKFPKPFDRVQYLQSLKSIKEITIDENFKNISVI